MQDPIPAGAVDLAKVRERADERDKAIAEVQEAQRQKQLEATAASWDRSMTRAFKGIMPAPLRHAFLTRSLKRDDA